MRGGVPPIATAVVKATACAGSRTERSAGAVSCFSVSKVRGRGGGGPTGGRPAASPPTGHCAGCRRGASYSSLNIPERCILALGQQTVNRSGHSASVRVSRRRVTVPQRSTPVKVRKVRKVRSARSARAAGAEAPATAPEPRVQQVPHRVAGQVAQWGSARNTGRRCSRRVSGNASSVRGLGLPVRVPDPPR